MLAVLIGIIYIITAVILWVAKVSTAHAIAILMGLLGVLLLAYGALPVYFNRRGPNQP